MRPLIFVLASVGVVGATSCIGAALHQTPTPTMRQWYVPVVHTPYDGKTIALTERLMTPRGSALQYDLFQFGVGGIPARLRMVEIRGAQRSVVWSTDTSVAIYASEGPTLRPPAGGTLAFGSMAMLPVRYNPLTRHLAPGSYTYRDGRIVQYTDHKDNALTVLSWRGGPENCGQVIN